MLRGSTLYFVIYVMDRAINKPVHIYIYLTYYVSYNLLVIRGSMYGMSSVSSSWSVYWMHTYIMEYRLMPTVYILQDCPCSRFQVP